MCNFWACPPAPLQGRRGSGCSGLRGRFGNPFARCAASGQCRLLAPTELMEPPSASLTHKKRAGSVGHLSTSTNPRNKP
ncbi:MAG: hypothetical protein N2050_04400 [Flavobacteriales bacterium]|nr:hypothetical protein [Flavobacteriales bacterium]MCX7649779.1 hypothetical protein [Flavobacteriales bacterium]MDW8432966.1 hypothetical protein [Flavobacteriales bacterium]